MSNVTLKVNSRTHTLDIDPATPLLYILRNDVARAVIINGAAVRSSITPQPDSQFALASTP